MPTLEEINAAAPDTPAFILHLYDRALLNRAALRAVGYTKDTPEPPGGTIERDKRGEPTGMLVARPNATILYKTLGLGPKLDPEDKEVSTRQFMRELNRLGVTGVIDAGGGSQVYPDDYHAVEALHRRGEMTVRVAYNLFTQSPGGEIEDFRRWAGMTRPGAGDSFYRMNGAGEMLTYSAADFEDFLEPRPDLPPALEGDLPAVVRLLAEKRWPFRLHATYDESIGRFLDIFEAVDRDVRLDGLYWFFDHAETVTDRNLERIKALGGGIAVQHRMAYQGEYFVDRYGAKAAERTPPIARMLEMGIPVAAGTDATRVASYNPWVCLHWLVTGRTVGGLSLYPEANRLGPGAGAAALDPGRRVVLERGGSPRCAEGGPVGRPRRADRGLFRRARGPHPGHRIGVDARGRQGRPRHRPPSPGTRRRRCRSGPDWSPVGVYGGYHRVAVRSRGGRRRAGRWPAPERRTASRHRLDGCQAAGDVVGRAAADAGRSEGRCLELVGGRGHEDPVEGIVRARDRRNSLRPRSWRTTRQAVKETSVAGPGGVKLTVRMRGPVRRRRARSRSSATSGTRRRATRPSARRSSWTGGSAASSPRSGTGENSPATTSRPCS